MKENRTLKILSIAIVLVLIGIAIIVFKKFNFGVNYSKNVRLEINLEKDFEISDVLQTVNEIYTKEDAIVRKAGISQDTIEITVKEISDEQNEELINKINEKYATSLTVDDITIFYNSNVRGRDLIRPYLLPGGIVVALILVFFAIRYYKLGLVKVLGSAIGTLVCTQVLYLMLTSIFGMVVNEATIVVGIVIAIFCLMYLIATYEKELKA